MVKRYLLYLLRWQLSTPILAPIIAFVKQSSSIFGTPEDWIGAAIANLVGGLIFFWVDRCIFSSKKSNPLSDNQEAVKQLAPRKVIGGNQLVDNKKHHRLPRLPQFRRQEGKL